ncbi:glycosyltransferase family 2 protein [Nitratidesulfovibrio vulgaris]|jgi:hypothetical protein|uniref:Glycosyl transferase, group 2 family protein n=2 Tax=Nitratidesulfovibrio vulgaris TaxID=881 RepID=Q72WK9_NITV2|nr:glycosyltransferase family 2 protein [Nitratidesulfovibrio vulgaris]AAS94467.1 glycosyl transferase, group 2 family protein [Nitratidesulfovibrio vulgaris str. Hildenborough]ABM30040.1 glycosyl transferase, family 2 [Nitratidesulfovibrio vulgaris DP4]ADP88315.1 glycosyl transferase family 2 [Nitratidesulfovibrio vulgaris RCH1]
MNQPFLSVVIATFNVAEVLRECLHSLASQTFRDFEVVIQDGASTDGTLAVAQEAAGRLPRLSLASVADSGIYDAWNRALPRVTGDWVLFLGSDDTLAGPDVLAQCARRLADLPPQVLYACGDALEVYPDGSSRAVTCTAEGATRRMADHIPFCHSSLWHRACLFEARHFDATLRIAADYDLICRTWPHDGVGHTLGITVTHMGVGGVSSSPAHRLRTQWELVRVAARHGHGAFSRRRLVPLCKAVGLWVLCRLAGRRASVMLDRLRVMRGLPPCWTTADPARVGGRDSARGDA